MFEKKTCHPNLSAPHICSALYRRQQACNGFDQECGARTHACVAGCVTGRQGPVLPSGRLTAPGQGQLQATALGRGNGGQAGVVQAQQVRKRVCCTLSRQGNHPNRLAASLGEPRSRTAEPPHCRSAESGQRWINPLTVCTQSFVPARYQHKTPSRRWRKGVGGRAAGGARQEQRVSFSG